MDNNHNYPHFESKEENDWFGFLAPFLFPVFPFASYYIMKNISSINDGNRRYNRVYDMRRE